VQPVISIQNVSKRFRDCQALRRVSLEVPRGVVFAVLGENGAGKTTLIRILTGYLNADEGTAEVLGYDPRREPLAVRRAIGYVSDAPALYDWMTPAEIGWFTSAFYDERFPARYEQLIVGYGVPPATRIRDLSRGQRAKVALALATAHDPQLLILDEPTSGLDPMVRRQFLESMVDRAAVGHAVLLSSHQISEVERVADWVAILHQGELKVVEPLGELKENMSIVTATLEDPFSDLPLPRGTVLTESRKGRQVRWLVQGLAEGWAAEYGTDSGATEVSVTKPTLEEVFVAVCDEQARRPEVEAAAETES
jgi:ABC-2 type transport system ATP-binding protein